MTHNLASVTIVGAGLTCLIVGRELQQRGLNVQVIEKSRGVGGRMATRRTEFSRFDHGAQYYQLRPEFLTLHERWKKADLVRPWFSRNGIVHVAAPAGMTSLAKNLSEGLPIDLGEKVVAITPDTQVWNLRCESGRNFRSERVLLTCPLPQSLEILKSSGVDFDPALAKVRYAKALVGLFENVSPLPTDHPDGIWLQPGPEIQMIVDQSAKGVSVHGAWSVIMASDWSEKHFDETDDVILEGIQAAIRMVSPTFYFQYRQLKKWRYSHPLQTFATHHAQVQTGLHLAGDAFGRPSLTGALESAASYLRHEFPDSLD